MAARIDQLMKGDFPGVLGLDDQPKTLIQRQLLGGLYLEASGHGNIVEDEAYNIGTVFLNRAYYVNKNPQANANFGNGTVFSALIKGSSAFAGQSPPYLKFFKGQDLKPNEDLESLGVLGNVINRIAWNVCVKVANELPGAVPTSLLAGNQLDGKSTIYFNDVDYGNRPTDPYYNAGKKVGHSWFYVHN